MNWEPARKGAESSGGGHKTLDLLGALVNIAVYWASPLSLTRYLNQAIAREWAWTPAFKSGALLTLRVFMGYWETTCTKAQGNGCGGAPSSAWAGTKNVAFFYFRKTSSRDGWVPGTFPPHASLQVFWCNWNGHFLRPSLPLSQYPVLPSGRNFTIKTPITSHRVLFLFPAFSQSRSKILQLPFLHRASLTI